MAFLDKMVKDCALEYSDKEDMRILQRHLYIGIIFDKLKSRVFIGKEKFDQTMALLLELMQQVECTPRMMSKLGESADTSFVASKEYFLGPFNQFVGGPESALEWDKYGRGLSSRLKFTESRRAGRSPCRPVRLLRSLVGIRGRRVFFVNDCLPGVWQCRRGQTHGSCRPARSTWPGRASRQESR